VLKINTQNKINKYLEVIKMVSIPKKYKNNVSGALAYVKTELAWLRSSVAKKQMQIKDYEEIEAKLEGRGAIRL
jgi:hypothetical protein